MTDALQKIHSNDAFDALAASLDQTDTRVKKRVISSVGQFYRTEARDMLLAIARDESNSGLAAAAISNLGRYHDKDIPPILLDALSSRSYRDIRATAAVSSFNKLKDVAYVPALIELATTRQNDYPSREFGSVLSTLAVCAKHMDDTTDARDTLLSLINHPKRSLRISAIRALGVLGDKKAAAVLETLAFKQRQVNGKTDPVQRAAQTALQQVQKNMPLAAPEEVVELRKNVKTLEQNNAKLEDKLNDLESRLDALKSAD
ncbi:MAG: HEAT repeat domain-containing protein [Phycisphaeraceae bacterium]|nr:HEAT repeat domain-containing protein [Phycisphaeraceae bacterium]